MSYSQSELGDRFARGATGGAASNVKIRDGDGYTALVGYGHALYALRDDQTGNIVAFTGWYGYSMSTSCQFSRLGLTAAQGEKTGRNATFVDDDNPKALSARPVLQRFHDNGGLDPAVRAPA